MVKYTSCFTANWNTSGVESNNVARTVNGRRAIIRLKVGIESYEGSEKDWARGRCPRCLMEVADARRVPLALSGTKKWRRMNMNKNAACREELNCTNITEIKMLGSGYLKWKAGFKAKSVKRSLFEAAGEERECKKIFGHKTDTCNVRVTVVMYSSTASTKSLSFCKTVFSLFLTKLTTLLPQSHDYCSCYVSRRILAPAPLWLQKHNHLCAHGFAHSYSLWHQPRLPNVTCPWSWRVCGIIPAIVGWVGQCR